MILKCRSGNKEPDSRHDWSPPIHVWSKSKLENLPMVNDTDNDNATAPSKITGWKLAAQLTHEAVE
jgi:hypothetical protein